MIIVDKSSLKAKLFRLCLNHPMARGDWVGPDGKAATKPVDWYLENGTTLCHFFWVCFWLPIGTIVVLGGVFGMFTIVSLVSLVEVHIQAYHNHGVIGLFIPAGTLIGITLSVALLILSIVGAGKVGLWGYLMALKERVCPRMAFK